MGRAPCCEKVGLKKGRWTKEEDEILARYIKEHGEGSWRSLPKNAGMDPTTYIHIPNWLDYSEENLKRKLLRSCRLLVLCLPIRLISDQLICLLLLQGCCGAGRAAGCDGSTTWGRISRGGTSRRRRKRWSSSSTPRLATGTHPWPISIYLPFSPSTSAAWLVCRLHLSLWFLHLNNFTHAGPLQSSGFLFLHNIALVKILWFLCHPCVCLELAKTDKNLNKPWNICCAWRWELADETAKTKPDIVGTKD